MHYCNVMMPVLLQYCKAPSAVVVDIITYTPSSCCLKYCVLVMQPIIYIYVLEVLVQ